MQDFRERVKSARAEEGIKLQILKDFEPLIKRCIGIYLKDMSQFDDAMQEGRIAILKCIDGYDINSNIPFEGYIKRAVIYCIRDFAGRIKDAASLDEEINEDGGCLHDILDSGVDIEGEKIFGEDVKKLKKALDKLPDNYADILRKYYIERMSLKDISKGRRCHYMTVVKLKERAIKRLRELFETEEQA